MVDICHQKCPSVVEGVGLMRSIPAVLIVHRHFRRGVDINGVSRKRGAHMIKKWLSKFF